MEKEGEENMKTSAVSRMFIVLVAISLAASGAVGADRMVLQEQFKATW